MSHNTQEMSEVCFLSQIDTETASLKYFVVVVIVVVANYATEERERGGGGGKNSQISLF